VLSQSQLAQRVGVAQAAISRIERDQTHDPGVLIVAAIALALGLSLEDLLAGHVSLPLPKRCLLEERVARLEALLGVPPL
jgi:transcriptional regulator with XRE-family HTH domain